MQPEGLALKATNMGIRTTCPACGKSFTVKDRYAGIIGSCYYCQATVRVPDSNEFDELGFEQDANEDPSSSQSLLNAVIKIKCPVCGKMNFSGLAMCMYCDASLPQE